MNQRIKELARMARSRDPKQPLIALIVGHAGTGKTFHMEVVMRWARQVVAPYLFASYICTFLLGNMEQSLIGLISNESSYDERGDKARERIGSLITSQLLIIDDLGNERNPPPSFEAGLSSLIDQRTKARRPTWIVTNESFEGIQQRYGARNFSRIVNAAEVIKISGKDRRKKHV